MVGFNIFSDSLAYIMLQSTDFTITAVLVCGYCGAYKLHNYSLCT